MSKYSMYCIEKCPIGKKQSDKFLEDAESAWDAAFDMQMFVNKCLEKGCPYEKERQEKDHD